MQRFLMKHLGLVVLLLLYVGFSATLIPVAIDDIRMADVYSVDESGAAIEIRYYLATGRLDRASFKYGSLFYYIPYVALSVYGAFDAVRDQVILTVLRWFGTLSGVGCILLLYALGCRLYDRTAGLVSAAILATAPAFARWSVESHPDLPQMLCVCAFLWVLAGLAERLDLKQSCLAACFAAVAFNVKYVGIFLMPTLFLAILLLGRGTEFSIQLRTLTEVDRWKIVVAALLTFLAVSAITNPYAVLNYDSFVKSLQAERKIMSFGHTVRASGGVVAWLAQFSALAGWVHLGVFTIALIAAGTCREKPRSAVVAFWIWFVSYLLYLIVFSQLIRARHALPLFPVLAMGCGWAYRWMWLAMKERRMYQAAQATLVVVFVIGLYSPVKGVAGLAQVRLDRMKGSDEIKAGRWLGEHYNENTSIMYHSYAYVPGKFMQCARSFGMTYLAIEHFRPDLLVVRNAIVSDYADTSRASDSRIGRAAYLDSHYFYEYLSEGRILAYREVKAYPSLRVYERTKKLKPRDASWDRLIKMFGAGKALGGAAARLKMSELHLLAGRHDEARLQRMLAEKSRSNAVDKFNLAKAFLMEGKLQEARKVFDDMMSMVVSQPAMNRAQILQHISRAFFETSYYVDAVRAARLAVETYDSLQEAHFELGIFLLAAGKAQDGHAVLSRAAGRFGKSPEARDLLEQIARNDIVPDEARRAIQRHF